MRKWLCSLALVIALFLPAGARAEGETRFSSVKIDIWPEYDRPAVLVIEHLTLAADVALPAALTVRIPAEATVNAVASREVDGALLNLGYEKQVEGNWMAISFSAMTRDIQIEFYDTLSKQGATRQYSFLWPADYAVDVFSIQFQMPVDATGFQSTPLLPTNRLNNDGLLYYTGDFGALEAGQTFSLNSSYEKATDTLSASSPNIQPSQSPTSASGRVTLAKYVPWVFGILGIILILIGLVAGASYLQGRRRNGSGASRPRHAARREKEPEAIAAVYCHQCGRRAQPGDLFCRACGTRLRHG
jgi:hypothetical protein